MRGLFIIIVIFLLVGAYSISKQNNYNLKDNPEDRSSFYNDFTGWLVNLGGNVKDVGEEATKKEWLPTEKNETDSIK